MADKTAAQAPEDAQPPEAAPAPASAPAPAPAAEATATKSGATTKDANPSKVESESAVDAEKKDEEAKNVDGDKPTKELSTAAATTTAPADEEKPTSTDAEMTDKPAEDVTEPVADKKAETEKPADEPADAAAESAVASGSADADAGGDKSKARRKSSALPEHLKGGKKLNKKASKAKILHLDAKPGDHFFAKLKGFPLWPVIICEEEMLPQNMLSTRPVTAARPDGTYREDFADGGKRAADRTYPVMYLHTNEFGWTVNTDLSELDPSTVADLITPKMRKDLQSAHLLAAEHNDLDYYKNVLREFEEQRLANLEAKAAKARTPKKKAAEPAVDEDGDLEMVEADEEDEENVETSKKKKTKKRKADDDHSTPQRSESVKKPKIKLTSNSTPKNINGTQSPNPAKESTSKSSKSKAKQSKAAKEAKDAEAKQAEAEAAAAATAVKEPELTAEERKMRKEKEILFLRHRLQKGLLVRDQEPKEEEMLPMSEFLAKLETFPDLEVAIIRATKINKVLKAIIKLESIPKEDEFKFKPRSQSLLEKWNKILSTDGAPATPAATNGVNGTSGEGDKKDKEATNGVKETTTKVKSDSPKDAQKETAPEQTKEETGAKTASAGDSETEDKPAAEDV